MFIFGYGSLMWKADFPYVQKIPGFVTGYIRRFWQASEDHRGVPGKPGRVVTLISTQNPKDVIWGVTYEIDKEDEENVVSHLDFREKDGYTKNTALFYPVAIETTQEITKLDPLEVVLYIATEDNKFFMKNETFEETAACIASAHGPSGSNAEYLFNLAAEMRRIAPHYDDTHLFALENAVRKIQSNKESTAKA
ncbi:putative glutathione-specific gamma-glutamylcyclotransferase 2 [Schistocerca americana]|uniref:putative glutathione-specific gamma-glutamylcyclotransferase 2 n=1 Tax=Schistocerca americana TaxID=7009 RepID=UPI001F4FBB0F|nr:putative glutathione-specific gamma-glutamylcyclotransferase 2 [Schistocerca americana]